MSSLRSRQLTYPISDVAALSGVRPWRGAFWFAYFAFALTWILLGSDWFALAPALLVAAIVLWLFRSPSFAVWLAKGELARLQKMTPKRGRLRVIQLQEKGWLRLFVAPAWFDLRKLELSLREGDVEEAQAELERLMPRLRAKASDDQRALAAAKVDLAAASGAPEKWRAALSVFEDERVARQLPKPWATILAAAVRSEYPEANETEALRLVTTGPEPWASRAHALLAVLAMRIEDVSQVEAQLDAMSEMDDAMASALARRAQKWLRERKKAQQKAERRIEKKRSRVDENKSASTISEPELQKGSKRRRTKKNRKRDRTPDAKHASTPAMVDERPLSEPKAASVDLSIEALLGAPLPGAPAAVQLATPSTSTDRGWDDWLDGDERPA